MIAQFPPTDQQLDKLKNFIKEIFARGGKIYIRYIPPGQRRGSWMKVFYSEENLDAIAKSISQQRYSIYVKFPRTPLQRVDLPKLLNG